MLSQSLRVDRGEGDIATSLGNLAAAHPEVSIGSYPFQRDGVYGSNVVVRSQNGAAVDTVMAELARLFPEAG
jgi:molybdopterin-biosynthesis enzyme MoeA-like protein